MELYKSLHAGRLYSKKFQSTVLSQVRYLTNVEASKKRNALFNKEKARQAALITRVEKIRVEHKGPPESCTLLMNKGLSTPFNCAMHLGELLVNQSVIALVNGEAWDMHRPLVDDCELRFQHFRDENPHLSNLAFWRSCSFVIGYILERAFKDEYFVELCSFPKPSVTSGSFVYDVHLPTAAWKPSPLELSSLSRIGGRLSYEDLKFERLEVDASVALEMFADNRFKSAQIPHMAAQSKSGSAISLYRLNDHVDISRGPLIASTKLLGRFSITAVHDIVSATWGPLKRVQGVAVPKHLPIHFWAFDQLCARAAKLNGAALPALVASAADKSEKTAETTNVGQ